MPSPRPPKNETPPSSSLLVLLLLLGCESSPTTIATTPTATATTSASASSQEKTPTVGAFVTRKEARESGLPDVGVRIADVHSSFAALTAPRTGTYLSLGGPPGGVLMFVVRGFSGTTPSAEAVPELYRAYLKNAWAVADPPIEGAAEMVTIAGDQRHARAFIKGKAPARESWCVMLVPSPRNADEGLLVLAGVAVPDSEKVPACRQSLSHDRIRPLVASLSVE